MEALHEHSWPGNVRELENAIEWALTVCDDDEIQLFHLSPAVLRVSQSPQPTTGFGTANLTEMVDRYERAMICAALAECNWNKSRAATALKITRRILAYKMQKLGIKFRGLDSRVPPGELEI